MVPYYSSNTRWVWTIEHGTIEINLDKTSLRRSPPCSSDATTPKLQFCSPCGYLYCANMVLACSATWWSGLDWRFNRTLFRWLQTLQAINANSSRGIAFSTIHDSNSFTLENPTSCLKLHGAWSAHTTSNSGHDHKACFASSTSNLHLSQIGSATIFLLIRACLVGNTLRQARQIKFLIFSGTCIFHPNHLITDWWGLWIS